jgi:hypothetical protein
LRSGAARKRGVEAEQKPLRSGRGGKPVSDDLRRWNGAQWNSHLVERLTGDTKMQRSGDVSNCRRQAPKRADVSLKVAFGDSSALEGLGWGRGQPLRLGTARVPNKQKTAGPLRSSRVTFSGSSISQSACRIMTATAGCGSSMSSGPQVSCKRR